MKKFVIVIIMIIFIFGMVAGADAGHRSRGRSGKRHHRVTVWEGAGAIAAVYTTMAIVDRIFGRNRVNVYYGNGNSYGYGYGYNYGYYAPRCDRYRTYGARNECLKAAYKDEIKRAKKCGSKGECY